MTPTAGQPNAAERAEGVMSSQTKSAFDAEILQLRASNNSGPTDRRVAVLGIVLAVVGLATIVVCYSQATGFDDQRDQLESLILAMFGVGLVIFGSALYLRNSLTRFLRFWLLRLIYEQRDTAQHAAAAAPAPATAQPVPSQPADTQVPAPATLADQNHR
jgi:hypothetical protein